MRIRTGFLRKSEGKKPFGDPGNAVVEQGGRGVCSFASPSSGVPKMVISRSKHTRKPRVPQASAERPSQPNKINANTTFDFEGKNLTPYGGLFPVATMLEKLKFQELIEEIITVKR